ncbi:MAG TPA: RidA family protein [Sphingomicrobium sp.]|nr:RidA family protein [Sphingomicrobium sp.]
MKILQPAGWPRPSGYAHGISAQGRLVFTAGIIGSDETGMVPSRHFEQQFGQALRNILAILAEDGAGPEHIVRLTIYVTDRFQYISRRDDITPIWKSLMRSHYPAIALVEVKGLVNSAALVEIEATAVVPE